MGSSFIRGSSSKSSASDAENVALEKITLVTAEFPRRGKSSKALKCKEVIIGTDAEDLSVLFSSHFSRYREGLLKAVDGLDHSKLSELVRQLREARERGSAIYVCGNGGSAAIASHLAADIGKIRYKEPESYFRISSLNDNVPILTATANDVGYEKIFVHQLQRFLKPQDVVIVISSSGNSPNVVEVVKFANNSGANTWGIVGFSGGEISQIAENTLYIPSNAGDYGFMEDTSSVIIHLVTSYLQKLDDNKFTAI